MKKFLDTLVTICFSLLLFGGMVILPFVVMTLQDVSLLVRIPLAIALVMFGAMIGSNQLEKNT